jgi:hypothetical protein
VLAREAAQHGQQLQHAVNHMVDHQELVEPEPASGLRKRAPSWWPPA